MKTKKLKDLILNNEIKQEDASKITGGKETSLTIEEAVLMSGGHRQAAIAKTSLTIEEAVLMSGAHQTSTFIR